MAAIGVALWKYVMRYAPHTPTYFDRDRFVLSNGKFYGLEFFESRY
jgi:dihydroxyacetone synthase